MSGGERSRGSKWLNRFLSVLVVLITIPCLPLQAELPTGLPPIHVIHPEPGTYPRFYSVAQSPDGLLHVGGSEGIHSYDGRRWQFMSMPNGHIVRSLKHDGRQRLYVGGYGMFGYALQSPDGLLEFVDLTPPEENLPGDNVLADVWQILLAPEGVYFSGVQHLFLFDPDSGEIQSWYHPDRFGVITRHESHTLVQFRGIGVKVFNGNGFELIDGGSQLTSHLYALLPLPDGGLVTLGRDGRWLHFAEGRVEPWSGGAGLPSSDSFSASLILPDQTIALAKTDGGLYVVDPRTLRSRRFQVANEFISDLALANDGGLLVQFDSGTAHVSWPSSWTRIGAEAGLRGRVHSVNRWNDQWLVMTNAGVHRAGQESAGTVKFERTDFTPFEAWDWVGLGDDSALLAESYQLIHIQDTNRTSISSDTLYPRLLKPSRFNDDLLYVGTELGLAVFERNGPSWTKRFAQQDFTGRVRAVIELAEGRVLAAINDHGLIEVEFNAELSDISRWQQLDSANGLIYANGSDVELFRFGPDSVVISTPDGFFTWQDGHIERSELAGLAAHKQSDTAYQVKLAPDGTWWAHSHKHLLRRPPGADWIVEDITALNPGVISSLNFTEDGRVLIGGIASILEFDPQMVTVEPAPPLVTLRTVILTDADGQEQRLPLDGREIIIRHDLINMIFEYALPSYRRPELTRYQSRMTGYEDHFSDWGNVTRITFSRLTPGDYRFVVRARDGQNHISEAAPFEFTVMPPWYLTIWAKLLWVVLALTMIAVAVYGLLRWRLARVSSERERLSDMVDRRTAELAAANRQLENMANVDGLTSVANRRRLDEYMIEAWDRCLERDSDVSIILIDVDHFKDYNDTYGHQAGDDVLRKVAKLLSSILRRNEDIVGRYGGEEFMCVLPGAPESMAMEVAESMREQIDHSFDGISVSVGLATVRPNPEERFTTLIERADRALYAAKQAGRNRVCMAEA